MRRLSLLLVTFLVPALTHAQATWKLAETVRYGGGRPEATIADSGALAVARDGVVYAPQVADGTVLMFDASGAYRKTIGRRGQGPGEFVRPTRVGMVGDTLWVSDEAQRRVSFFRRNGTFIRSQMVVFAVRDPFLPGQPTTLLNDGTAVSVAAVGASFVRADIVNRLPLMRHERDGKVLDTLRWMAFTNMTGGVRLGRTGGLFYKQPFGDGSFVAAAVDGSGLVVVDPITTTTNKEATFTVTGFGPTGAPVYSRSVPFKPIPLTARHVDAALEKLVKPLPKDKPGLREGIEQTLYRPRFLPPATQAVLATDGAVWLRGEDTDAPTVLYRVLDPKGTLTATLTLPRHLTIRHATITDVWAFGTDDDVPYLARFRIVK